MELHHGDIMKAALTKEEWEAKFFVPKSHEGAIKFGRWLDGVYVGHPNGGFWIYEEECHALGALCLYEQPFGFTHKGVSALHAMLDHAERWLAGQLSDYHEYEKLALARYQAAKIEALLPPRDLETP